MACMTAKWRLLFSCVLVATLALPALAQKAPSKDSPPKDSRIPLSERKRIAVLPFDDGAVRESSYYGRVFEAGRGVADMLTTALLKTNKFRVIEREKVDAVLAEQDLGKTGRVDAATAARIGKVLGVEYLLIGRVTEFSVETKGGSIGAVGRGDLRDLSLSRSVADVKLDGRLVDSTSGEILFAFTGGGHDSRTNVGLAVLDIGRVSFGSAEFLRTILGAATRAAVDNSVKEVASAADELIYRPPDLSKINGYVVYIEGPDIMTNLGARYGVKVGDRFQILRPGKEIHDPQTGELLTVLATPVGVLRIDRVEEKVSTGTIAEKAAGLEVQIGDVVKPVVP
jgi:curli biogenesis system outer membrane secretion channel CsgG